MARTVKLRPATRPPDYRGFNLNSTDDDDDNVDEYDDDYDNENDDNDHMISEEKFYHSDHVFSSLAVTSLLRGALCPMYTHRPAQMTIGHLHAFHLYSVFCILYNIFCFQHERSSIRVDNTRQNL